MLMQRRPGEKQWQKLDFVSVCVFTSSVRADLPCTEEPSVSSCFSFPVRRWARRRKMRKRRREGGWTFGEVNPRRTNSSAWCRRESALQWRRRIHVLHYTLVGEKRRCREKDGQRTTDRRTLELQKFLMNFIAAERFDWS